MIANDYAILTWILFLRSKNEIFDVLKIFVNLVQKKLNTQFVGIRFNNLRMQIS